MTDEEALESRRRRNDDVLHSRRACPCCGGSHMCRRRQETAARAAASAPTTTPADAAARAADFAAAASAASEQEQRFPPPSFLCPAHFMPDHIQRNFHRQSRRLGLEELEVKTALVLEALHRRLELIEDARSGSGLGTLLTWDGYGGEGENDDDEETRSPSPAVTVILAGSSGPGGVSEHDEERMRASLWSREDEAEADNSAEDRNHNGFSGQGQREDETFMSETERAYLDAEWDNMMYDQTYYGNNSYPGPNAYYGTSRMPADVDFSRELDLITASFLVDYQDSDDDDDDGDVEEKEDSDHDK